MKSPLKFFALVFLFSLPFWVLGAFSGRLSSTLPVNLPASALMFICPAAAALLLVRSEAGSDGVRALLRRAVDYRRIPHWLWYLPIIGLMPLVMLLSYGLLRLLDMPLPEPQLRLELVAILLLVFLFSAACEQIGWTGYVADPLQERWGVLRASIVVGVVWALWHVVPYLQAGHTLNWVLWQCVATVALRVLIDWIYTGTGKSVFATILFHAMIDVSTFSFPNNGSGYSPLVTGSLLVVAAAIVAIRWGSATLAPQHG